MGLLIKEWQRNVGVSDCDQHLFTVIHSLLDTKLLLVLFIHFLFRIVAFCIEQFLCYPFIINSDSLILFQFIFVVH